MDGFKQLETQCDALDESDKIVLVQRLCGQKDMHPLEWLSLTSVLQPKYFERYKWIRARIIHIDFDLRGVTVSAEPTGVDPKAFFSAMAMLGGPHNISVYVEMPKGKCGFLLSHVLSFDNFWKDFQDMLKKKN